jgi:hypothetical protein
VETAQIPENYSKNTKNTKSVSDGEDTCSVLPCVVVAAIEEEIRRTVCGEAAPSLAFAECSLDAEQIGAVLAGVRERLGIELPEDVGPLSDASQLIEAARRAALLQGITAGFEFHCESAVEIDCAVERAYDALTIVRDWPRIQRHIRAIEVIYDDGRFQELYMETTLQGVQLRLRTIRRCEPCVGTRFFQLQPPPSVQHHTGAYILHRLAARRCRVTALQCWTMAAEGTPELRAQRSQLTSAMFHEYARLSLGRWKEYLESASR